MNINTLTIKAQEALQAALSLARERGQQAVEPLHLLAVLIREDDSLSTFLLGRVGVNVRSLRDEVGRAVASLPRVEGGGEQFFAQDTSKAIQRAVDFTKNFGDKIRLRRTPAAGPRGRARAGRRHPQTQRRDGKGAD